MSASVAVYGEALLDLILQPDGDYRPHMGGSPFNVALALARQDVSVSFLSPFGSDLGAAQLRGALLGAGVRLPAPPSDRPTSLALVFVDEEGQPDYALYRGDVADRDTTSDQLIALLPDRPAVVHTGSLALTPDSLPVVQPWFVEARRRGALVAVDLNLRPKAVRDQAAYRAGLMAVLPLCDLVKLSDEDARHLGLDGRPQEIAAGLLPRLHPDGGLAVVTAGHEGAWACTHGGSVHQPVHPASTVVDTVGAGDCFQAGLLAGLLDSGLVESRAYRTATASTLRPVLARAAATASLNVARAGCSPPSAEEVAQALASAQVR